MQLDLKTPELTNFIDAEVQAGHFSSREAAVEAAIKQMMLDQELTALSDADMAAIQESDAQIDRNEYVDFDTFASEMRKKYAEK